MNKEFLIFIIRKYIETEMAFDLNSPDMDRPTAYIADEKEAALARQKEKYVQQRLAGELKIYKDIIDEYFKTHTK